MARRRLLWQLFPLTLLVILAAVGALTWSVTDLVHDFYCTELGEDLRARARIVEDPIREALVAGDRDRVETLCERFGQASGTRITVVAPDGTVLGDSHERASVMENHGNRPEIAAALEGGFRTTIRRSRTLHERLMYAAVRVREGERVLGVIRTAIPASPIDASLAAVSRRILLSGLVVALAAGAASLWIARRVARPLEAIRRGAERLARGDLEHEVSVDGPIELVEVAATMNQMAAQLDDRLRTLVAQRNEREAILSSMVEGVLAVDGQQRVISMNRAAGGLLGIEVHRCHGRALQEVSRNPELLQIVNTVFGTREPVVGEIVLYGQPSRFLQVHGTVLRDGEGHEIGALAVLADVTRIKRLENVRRDFVANVSHELKTPVTSIKGFVETLLDGAMQSPEDAERFLGIIASQADRLGGIIEDLLTLSRVEQETEKAEILLERGRLEELLRSAVGFCEMKAHEKGIRVDLACEPGLEALLNPPLLEQAIVNLIDNAIKYSPEGETVQVEARRSDGEICIRVRDQGCGIPRQHLDRLFERFYRVDKARSRKLGGTGLGLAIVKHIAQAHNGRATVESQVGQGSVFTVHLPGADPGVVRATMAPPETDSN